MGARRDLPEVTEVRPEPAIDDFGPYVVKDSLEGVPYGFSGQGRWATLTEDFLEQDAGFYVDLRLAFDGHDPQEADFAAFVKRLASSDEVDFRPLNCDAFQTLLCHGRRGYVEAPMFVLVGEYVEMREGMVWSAIPVLVRLYLKNQTSGWDLNASQSPAPAALAECAGLVSLPELTARSGFGKEDALRQVRHAFLECELPGEMVQSRIELVEELADQDGPVVRERQDLLSVETPVPGAMPFVLAFSNEHMVLSFPVVLHRVLKRHEMKACAIDL